jgi:outer membrane protein assembly factor BamE (lipoprotein component of BamABCDE complex)
LFSQQETIERLERRVADLEKRVATLEQKLSSSQSTNIQYSEKWKNRSNWRKLQRGMTMEQVESLLGTPLKIDGGYLTYWYYSSQKWHSYVVFESGKLDSWTEPN